MVEKLPRPSLSPCSVKIIYYSLLEGVGPALNTKLTIADLTYCIFFLTSHFMKDSVPIQKSLAQIPKAFYKQGIAEKTTMI